MQLEKANFVGDEAKGQISKRVLQENKAGQIFQKTNSFYPELCARVYQGVRDVRFLGGKKCSFFGKFGQLCFLVTSVLRFALLPYYRRIIVWSFR